MVGVAKFGLLVIQGIDRSLEEYHSRRKISIVIVLRSRRSGRGKVRLISQ